MYVVGIHQNHLTVTLLLSTNNMFLWRIGENYPIIITKYSSLTIPLTYGMMGHPNI